MKIVAILGSPRPQGSSAGLAGKFLDEARSQGAVTEIYRLNQLDFKGCQGCRTCKTKDDQCVLKDDLGEVLAAVRDADLLLLASPVYFGDLSGQLKCFFDRTYSYLNPDFSSRIPSGKQAVLVLVQANPDPDQFNDIFPRYERWLRIFGFQPVYLLRATGVRDPEDLERQPEVLAQAAALAREVMGAA
jgi:multimeric flavodoxin WrbA